MTGAGPKVCDCFDACGIAVLTRFLHGQVCFCGGQYDLRRRSPWPQRPLQVEILRSSRLPLNVPGWVFLREPQESCPLRWPTCSPAEPVRARSVSCGAHCGLRLPSDGLSHGGIGGASSPCLRMPLFGASRGGIPSMPGSFCDGSSGGVSSPHPPLDATRRQATPPASLYSRHCRFVHPRLCHRSQRARRQHTQPTTAAFPSPCASAPVLHTMPFLCFRLRLATPCIATLSTPPVPASAPLRPFAH
jgi:hypothetical protein